MLDIEALRKLLLEATPGETESSAETEDVKKGYIYLPNGHAKALEPDVPLIVGGRGSGKSFWTKCLLEMDYREQLKNILPKNRFSSWEKVGVYAGYRAIKDIRSYPDGSSLEKMLAEGHAAKNVWKAVVINHLLKESFDEEIKAQADLPFREMGDWGERSRWVTDNPQSVARFIGLVNDALKRKDRTVLILFDALDTVSTDWSSIRQTLRGLFEILQEYRFFSSIKLKAFVRPDMIDPEEDLFAFPDASKLKNSQTKLSWTTSDLYGLLWQRLVNTEGGNHFRDVMASVVPDRCTESGGIWQTPSVVKREPESQKKIFEILAGNRMGSGSKKGHPYSWLPNHLGDTRGEVSPRSFLTAIHEGASESDSEDQGYPLHYRGIQKGVQKASKIRVSEMNEDYPWMNIVMDAMRGFLIPCEESDLLSLWEEKRILEKLTRSVTQKPRRIDDGLRGVIKDLEDIGVFKIMKIGRINIPDVYRIGYGMKRKGGVRPVK